MSDPYLDWLEIPHHLRPPTHYQLLGIAPSELDPHAITAAAERQLARLRPHEGGPLADECARIAAEVARARDTLLDPLARQRYDLLTPDAADPWWKTEGGTSPDPGPAVVAAEPAPGTGAAATTAEHPAAPPTSNDDWWKGQSAEPPPADKASTGTAVSSTPTGGKWWNDPAAIEPSAPVAATAEPPRTDWWKNAVPDAPPAVAAVSTVVAHRPTVETAGRPTASVPSPPAAPAAIAPAAPPARAFEELDARLYQGRKNSPLPWVLAGLVGLAVAGTVAIYFLKKGKLQDDSTRQVVDQTRKGSTDSGNEKKDDSPTPADPRKTEPAGTDDPLPKKTDPEPKKTDTEPKEPPKADDFSERLTLRGHNGGIFGVAVSRDAKTVLSVSDDKNVLVHAPLKASHSVLYQLTAEGVAVVLCNQDKKAVFTDGFQTIVYDLGVKQVTNTFQNPRGGIQCLAAAPDGTFVLTGSTDSCVRLWSVAANKLERTFDLDQKASVTALAIAPDGRTAAIGLSDGRVCSWDLRARREVRRWQGHTGRVTALAMAPDGQRVLSGGEDGVATTWQANSGKMLVKITAHKGAVLGTAWGADGQRFVTAGVDKRVCLWDAGKGRATDWSVSLAEKVFSLAIDAQDRFVLAGLANGTLQLLPLPRPAARSPEAPAF